MPSLSLTLVCLMYYVVYYTFTRQLYLAPWIYLLSYWGVPHRQKHLRVAALVLGSKPL
jgi:hypothetical protein